MWERPPAAGEEGQLWARRDKGRRRLSGFGERQQCKLGRERIALKGLTPERVASTPSGQTTASSQCALAASSGSLTIFLVVLLDSCGKRLPISQCQ